MQVVRPGAVFPPIQTHNLHRNHTCETRGSVIRAPKPTRQRHLLLHCSLLHSWLDVDNNPDLSSYVIGHTELLLGSDAENQPRVLARPSY